MANKIVRIFLILARLNFQMGTRGDYIHNAGHDEDDEGMCVWYDIAKPGLKIIRRSTCTR